MRSFTLLTHACLVAQALAEWPLQTYRTEKFVAPTFQVNRTAASAPGYLFLGMVHPKNKELSGPIITTDDGELVWHGTSATNNSIYNFQTQLLLGKPILSWWSGNFSFSHGYGSVTILDQEYDKLYQVCLPDSVRKYIKTPKPYPNNCLIDKHESIMTNRSSIIVSVYNATQTDLTAVGGPKNGWVFDCLFFELELGTNNVLFQWSALKNVPVTESNYVNQSGPNPLQFGHAKTGITQSNPWDYFHMNAVQPIVGGYIVNSRYTWSFYVLGTDGSVQHTIQGNTGGDFKFQQPVFFSFQHNARFRGSSGSNISISIFNNDNYTPFVPLVNSSNGYLLTMDTSTKKAYVSRFLNSTFPIYADAEGSYQALDNNHSLLGYGSRPVVQEFDESNKLIYSGQFSYYQASAFHSYRAYRLAWTSTPKTQPKIVSEVSTQGNISLVAYMSWNGATNFTQWNILGGTSARSLNVMAKAIPKQGFETQFVMAHNSSAPMKYMQVQALDSQGQVMGSSVVTTVVNIAGPLTTTAVSVAATTAKAAATSTSSALAPAAYDMGRSGGLAAVLAALLAFLP